MARYLSVSGKYGINQNYICSEIVDELGPVPRTEVIDCDEILKNYFKELFVVPEPSSLYYSTNKELYTFRKSVSSIDTFAWDRLLQERIKQVRDNANVVVCNVRYPSELALLQRLGFTNVRFKISDAVQKARVINFLASSCDLKFLQEEPETALDAFDSYFHWSVVADDNQVISTCIKAICNNKK